MRAGRVIRNDSPNDACHWSSKLTWGDGGMLKAAERGGAGGRLRWRCEGERGEMRRKMLLFSPSLLAEALRLWGSSFCSVEASLNTRCSYCDKWFSTVPNNSTGTQTHPHQIVPQLLEHKLHNEHTGLCERLFVLPPHETEGYFCFLFTTLLLWELTAPWKTLLEDLSAQFLGHCALLSTFSVILSSPLLILCSASSVRLFARLLCFPVSCLWQQTRFDTCTVPSPCSTQ